MSNQTIQKNFFSESKLLLVLAIPLILSGLVETSVGFFSNIFLAHLGTESLAAGALVNWVFTTIMVIIWGTLSAITTLVARYYGKQSLDQIQHVLCAGLLLAIVLMIPSMILLWNLAPIFLFFGQDPKTVFLAKPYLHGLTWAVIPDFIYTVAMQFVSGLGRTKINMSFSLLFVPLCIFFNYAFVFGVFSFPKLGIAGIGWGTALAFWIIAILFIVYFFLKKDLRIYLQIPPLKKITVALKEIFQVGIPLGLMYCVEIGFFLAMTILMGLINQDTLSANQITLQFFWLFSIVTFALGQGITIRVGHSVGRNDKKTVHYATYVGLFYACSYTLLVALLYWRLPNTLIGIDFKINDPNNAVIIQLAKEFLIMAALVQVVEAVRFVFFGSLRGLKDTKFSLLNSILIFWIVAFPLAYLAIFFDFAGLAIWWATLLGEIIGIPLLIWRYHRKVDEYLF
jgi:multidrug resistance protein, MATE family